MTQKRPWLEAGEQVLLVGQKPGQLVRQRMILQAAVNYTNVNIELYRQTVSLMKLIKRYGLPFIEP